MISIIATALGGFVIGFVCGIALTKRVLEKAIGSHFGW